MLEKIRYSLKNQFMHRADCLDEGLCPLSEENGQYNKKGPMINERFGPGMPGCLIDLKNGS